MIPVAPTLPTAAAPTGVNLSLELVDNGWLLTVVAPPFGMARRYMFAWGEREELVAFVEKLIREQRLGLEGEVPDGRAG